MYTPNTTTANTMVKANTPRFNMTYSRHEAPILIPIEYELMKQLGVDRSALHKTAIKEFYNRRQQSTLNMIWGRYGKDNQNLRCPLSDACWRRQALANETWWPGGGTGSGDVLKQDQEEIKGARNPRVSRTSTEATKSQSNNEFIFSKKFVPIFLAARFDWYWSVRFKSYYQPAWYLTTFLEWLLPVPLLLSSRAG